MVARTGLILTLYYIACRVISQIVCGFVLKATEMQQLLK